MEVISKRRSGVVAGSVWESRMKSDEVKGGIKVFKAEQQDVVIGIGNIAAKSKKSPIGSSKRKTLSPIGKNSEEQCIKKNSPISNRKIGDKFVRTPIQSRKLRSDGEAGELRLGKIKSDLMKKNDIGSAATDSVELTKTKSESNRVQEHDPDDEVDELVGGCEKIEENDENCEDEEIEEKEISSNVSVVKNSGELLVHDGTDFESDDGSYDEKVVDEEIEIERFDVKEISVPETKVVKEQENNNVFVTEQDKKIVKNEPEKKVIMNEVENKKVVKANMRFHHKNPLVVKQSPSIRRNSTIYQNFSKPNSIPREEEHSSFPQTQSKLQSLVDLIMWRDVSRSAFVFGIGTFIIVSSSYVKDINLSLISAVSYVGLIYLALIFLYRSLICRGVIEVEESKYVVGEKDAIWMLKLVLPYLNEFLSKLKALFSGDPGTTMKLAVLLFVLARCGSFITVWKMAKFGFFGVFIVPKVCSSYSAQLTAYANFWIRRFRDAWDSCTHKKAVALGIFGLVWNLSSVVARIWAVFILFVAFRYYQQHYMVRDEWIEEEDETECCDETLEDEPIRHKQPNFVATNKVKKGF